MSAEPIHIILADDNNLEHLLFAQLLRDLPHVVRRAARNGDELMQQLWNDSILPQLIFLNIHMPVKNGIECLTEIRQDARLSPLMVVIYSTSDESKHVDMTFKLGANMYLKKPLDFHELEESAVWIIEHYASNGIPTLDRDHFVFSLHRHKMLMMAKL